MSFQEKLTKDLVGEKLSSVTFVLNYLQLDFDGSGFTMFTWPEILAGGQNSMFSAEEYRNLLCSLIAKIVTKIEYIENVSLKIIFDDKNAINWSIDPNNQFVVTPEFGIYGNTDNEQFIFRD